ncbi:hypothetical protein [Pseudomonas protegens]|uniref:hypothetical protein n=1 Tax=Pseudomonas protegens TaxID=380021 RepID=UPI00069DDCD1|nr:hypothetical protein [Pseudomonas protegens]
MWWEKTVEYAFVQRFMPTSSADESFLAPLDGNHEKAGDAILALQSTLVLIEFKRARKDLKSEASKFFNYDDAKRELRKKDNHHLLVYGAAQRKSSLGLVARTYFSAAEVELEKFAERGVELDAFKTYLKLFLYHKGRNGGGGIAVDLEDVPPDLDGLDYLVVVGIVSGRTRFVMSLKDFLSSFKKPDGGNPVTQPIAPLSPSGIALKREKQLSAGLIAHE